jgi:CheY-like chemotaxis protein/anti-sigma regulatory factor (Ser/Thr protein kinase)/HPt (histidine-containing phosphotransfer) domain-containing protein
MSADQTATPGAERSLAEMFRDLIPNLSERAEAFCVSGEFLDDAVLAAFEEQMASTVEELRVAVDMADEAGVRRQAHSLQGMGGAAGAPEISVVGEELSRLAREGDFALCAALAARLANWSGLQSGTSAGPSFPLIESLSNAPEVRGRILIVDDERPNRLYLRKLLTARGGTVIEAESGEQALALAKTEMPELALVDVMMPGLSGYEVCRELKGDPATRDVTVIMVTARTAPEDVERAFVLGAFDYIRKPFHARELLARTRHALELKRQSDALHQWQTRMTREMDAAGALQRKLLAREPFFGTAVEIRFAHQASMSVGGDVFNAIPLSGDRVCFYVADVAGHGVAPAMIATLLKALVEDVAREQADHGPAAMCSDIHRRFRHYVTNPESYASMFIAIIEPDGRCATFNCGHPPPLLIDAHGSVLPAMDDRGGMPIGLPDAAAASAYDASDEIHVTLPRDGVIAVFSDGLIEARCKGTADACGVGTLAATLADAVRLSDAVDPARAVFDRLTAKGYDLVEDDCTLMVVRALDPASLRLKRTVAPTHAAVAALAAEVEGLLRNEGWPEESAGAVQLVAMEHGANVVDYGRLAPGEHIEFRLRLLPVGVELLFRDRGREWDFAERLAHARRQPVDSARGRGLRIIEAIARHSDLIRADGCNTSCYYVSRSFRVDDLKRMGDES